LPENTTVFEGLGGRRSRTLADACGGMSIGDKCREPPPAGQIALALAALVRRR
jgi:hypothetical protein